MALVSGKKLAKALLTVKQALAHEGRETKEMLEIYKKYLEDGCSPAELEKANQQFQELLKSLGLGVLLVLPFSPVTLPLAVSLGKKMGIDILPSSFRRKPEA